MSDLEQELPTELIDILRADSDRLKSKRLSFDQDERRTIEALSAEVETLKANVKALETQEPNGDYELVSRMLRPQLLLMCDLLDAKTREVETLKAEAERLVNVARGCHDYGGGYRAPSDYEIFHHGIQTVINALEAAQKNDPEDYQIKVGP